MSEQSETRRFDHGSPRIEGALEALYSTASPDAAFVAGLEKRLLTQLETRPQGERVARAGRPWQGWLQPLGQHRWATALAGVLLVVVVTVAAVGPQQVLASIQQLLGYVPGVGFVDLEATRLLVVPAEVARDGVTLRVEQVVARPEGTEVVIRSEGLPSEDALGPAGAWEGREARPVLRLPDGSGLTSGTWALRPGGGTLEFPPLPAGVYRVTLELARLPLVPAGAAPENWAVPLALQPATGELVAELFPRPYVAGVEAARQGITLRVLQVAHTLEETAVMLQIEWPHREWEFQTVGHLRTPELRDELGQVYRNMPPSSTGSYVQVEVIPVPEGEAAPAPDVATAERALAFAPLSSAAGQLTLSVDAVGLEVPAEAIFVVDLGDNPRVGDRWPLDVRLTVAGFPLRISGARLVQEELQVRDGTMQRIELQFDIDPVRDQDGRTLYRIALTADGGSFDGWTSGYDFTTGTMRAGLSLRDGAEVPAGRVEVQVERASIAFHGPWAMTWTIPSAD